MRKLANIARRVFGNSVQASYFEPSPPLSRSLIFFRGAERPLRPPLDSARIHANFNSISIKWKCSEIPEGAHTACMIN
jgi:hypothetical protein